MERKIIVQNASGIAGIVIPENESASSQIYYMLHCIQHRGPDACGIASANGERIFNEKGLGMLSEILNPIIWKNSKAFRQLAKFE